MNQDLMKTMDQLKFSVYIGFGQNASNNLYKKSPQIVKKPPPNSFKNAAKYSVLTKSIQESMFKKDQILTNSPYDVRVVKEGMLIFLNPLREKMGASKIHDEYKRNYKSEEERQSTIRQIVQKYPFQVLDKDELVKLSKNRFRYNCSQGIQALSILCIAIEAFRLSKYKGPLSFVMMRKFMMVIAVCAAYQMHTDRRRDKLILDCVNKKKHYQFEDYYDFQLDTFLKTGSKDEVSNQMDKICFLYDIETDMLKKETERLNKDTKKKEILMEQMRKKNEIQMQSTKIKPLGQPLSNLLKQEYSNIKELKEDVKENKGPLVVFHNK